jgi:hypothetical protein
MQRGGTASSGYFTDSVGQLLARLDGDASDDARALVATGRRLMAIFRTWMDERPPDDERVARVRELFEYNRGVLEYLAHRSAQVRSSIRVAAGAKK